LRFFAAKKYSLCNDLGMQFALLETNDFLTMQTVYFQQLKFEQQALFHKSFIAKR
jgi:hypothetical protein